MAQVESEVVAGNVRDIVNRLSRDMTNKNPFSVHQQPERRPLPNVSSLPSPQLYVATYAYNSKQDDELSFVVGDIIELISEVEDGWSKGKLKSTGSVGMYPTNFVALKPSPTTSSISTTSAIASTSGSRPKTGNTEVVMRPEPKAIDRTPSTIISEQSSSLKTFETKPSSVISSISPSSDSTETVLPETAKTKEMARVKFAYTPQHDDELALKDIDTLIHITNKNCGDAGWFEGELHGKKGLFPDNFVELVQVPVGTESGMKYGSVSRQATLNFVSHKPPPVNPPQPAVPPKPAKIGSAESIPPASATLSVSQAPAAIPTVTSNNMPVGTSGALKNTNFAALQERMASKLKVVAPENVASIQQKPTEQRDRSSTTESISGETPVDINGGGDQVTELQHITKNRARPPKNRPMSMVMNRNRSSDESPNGRLSSPTSVSSMNAMSASMFLPASKEITIPSNVNATSSPFKTSSVAPTSIAPPSSASKPALRPVVSNSLTDTNDSSSIRKLTSPDRKSPEVSSTSDYVSRAEYDALLDRFRALEARVIALEKHRF
ncbi:unnamed protein product [Caenorhabditis brenneri]